MKEKAKIFLFLLIILFSLNSVFVAALSDFKKEADDYIISKVGEEYFKNYFEFKEIKPYPEDIPESNEKVTRYIHKIKIEDYIENINVTVLFEFKNGTWTISHLFELPDCISNSSKCMPFKITKEEALEIARKEGVFNKTDKYRINIHFYYGNVNSYIWDVTTFESEWNGKTVIIDLNSGEVILSSSWFAVAGSQEHNNKKSNDASLDNKTNIKNYTLLDNQEENNETYCDKDEDCIIDGCQRKCVNIYHVVESLIACTNENLPDFCVCKNNKCVGNKNLSNGRKAEIKIMPETASERAIERLGELGFNITLKEVGKGEDIKLVYELTGNKQGKFLGIFKIMARVKAQVDAETGDVKVIKPWWSFLASGI